MQGLFQPVSNPSTSTEVGYGYQNMCMFSSFSCFPKSERSFDSDDEDDMLESEIEFLQQKQILLEKAMDAMEQEKGYDASKALDVVNGNIPDEAPVWEEARELLDFLKNGEGAKKVPTRKSKTRSSRRIRHRQKETKIDFTTVTNKSSIDVDKATKTTSSSTDETLIKDLPSLSDGQWWAKAMAQSVNPSNNNVPSSQRIGDVVSAFSDGIATKSPVVSPDVKTKKPNPAEAISAVVFRTEKSVGVPDEVKLPVATSVSDIQSEPIHIVSPTPSIYDGVVVESTIKPNPYLVLDSPSQASDVIIPVATKKPRKKPQQPKKVKAAEKTQVDSAVAVPAAPQSIDRQNVVQSKSPGVWGPAQEEEHRRFVERLEKAGKGASSGRWTAVEHTLFVQGLEQFGKDWKAISEFIKSRSVVQVRTHAQKYFQKLAQARKKGEEGEISMVPRGGLNKRKNSRKKRKAAAEAASPQAKKIATPVVVSPVTSQTVIDLSAKLAGPEVQTADPQNTPDSKFACRLPSCRIIPPSPSAPSSAADIHRLGEVSSPTGVNELLLPQWAEDKVMVPSWRHDENELDAALQLGVGDDDDNLGWLNSDQPLLEISF